MTTAQQIENHTRQVMLLKQDRIATKAMMDSTRDVGSKRSCRDEIAWITNQIKIYNNAIKFLKNA